MSRNAITRKASGNLAIRVVIWLLALMATAGAVMSIDKVLRNRSADRDAAIPVILPPAGGGDRVGAADQTADERSAAKAVESAAKTAINTATKTVAALSGVTDDEARHAVARHDEAGRDDGLPAFDIARVEPSGDTVVAGRAAPGATVELLRNGRVHDSVVADASGQFAMVPPRLPAGDSELTLRSKPRDGAAVVSKQTVVVSVQPNLKDQPVVALMAPDKPSVVLSKPSEPDISGSSVVVESVEAAAGGKKLYVTGHSAPGALVRLYLNDEYQSTATADASGRVAFTAASDGGGGEYQVRLDQVDRASGVIKSRAEVPFTAPQVVATAAPAADANPGAADGGGASGAGASPGPVAAPAPGTAPALPPAKGKVMTVSRGDSLWKISRVAYGDGTRYTVIYDANHRQIRNPNRIYPGQVFMIPKGR